MWTQTPPLLSLLDQTSPHCLLQDQEHSTGTFKGRVSHSLLSASSFFVVSGYVTLISLNLNFLRKQTNKKIRNHGAGKTVQSIKCLPWQVWRLKFNPQNPHKKKKKSVAMSLLVSALRRQKLMDPSGSLAFLVGELRNNEGSCLKYQVWAESAKCLTHKCETLRLDSTTHV